MAILTDELKLKIVEAYESGTPVTSIMEEYSVSRSQIYPILKEFNVEFRRPETVNHSETPVKSHTQSSPKSVSSKNTKKCPHCKFAKNPSSAKYCCMCGEDIRTPEQVCVEGLHIALRNCQMLPSSMIDDTVEPIRLALQILEKR